MAGRLRGQISELRTLRRDKILKVQRSLLTCRSSSTKFAVLDQLIPPRHRLCADGPLTARAKTSDRMRAAGVNIGSMAAMGRWVGVGAASPSGFPRSRVLCTLEVRRRRLEFQPLGQKVL